MIALDRIYQSDLWAAGSTSEMWIFSLVVAPASEPIRMT
jgi:hypothetical protein